ncbi:MAG: FAD-dependent oxidoreductase [Thermomicrobiales bacterium]
MTESIPSSVIVVGGGIIGSGIAYELAKRGVKVTLIERGRVGGEASWASAGIISLPHRPWTLPEQVELGRISLEVYPELVTTLEEMTGIGIDYRRPGEWAIAVDEEHAAEEDAVAEWQRGLGLDVEDVTPEEARRREPALPETLVRARFHPGVGSLSVHRLTQALAAAAKQHGATVLEETPVGGVMRSIGPGSGDDRVTGVRLQDRDLSADLTILATGAWTRLLGETIGLTLPIMPVKGQLIAFANAPLRPARVISGHGGYVRPRPDGTTMVAATEEYAGFDRRITGDGVAWLLELARTLCPVLLEGEIAETWTGLRPGSETNDPLIGPHPRYDGLWVTAGHFRTGAKEGPGTALTVAEAITTGQIPEVLRPFAPTTGPVEA